MKLSDAKKQCRIYIQKTHFIMENFEDFGDFHCVFIQ